jgi:hypothetical protein
VVKRLRGAAIGADPVFDVRHGHHLTPPRFSPPREQLLWTEALLARDKGRSPRDAGARL